MSKESGLLVLIVFILAGSLFAVQTAHDVFDSIKKIEIEAAKVLAGEEVLPNCGDCPTAEEIYWAAAKLPKNKERMDAGGDPLITDLFVQNICASKSCTISDGPNKGKSGTCEARFGPMKRD